MSVRMTTAETAAAVRKLPLARRLESVAAQMPAFPGPAGMRFYDIRALGRPVFYCGDGAPAEVAVIMPLYNYKATVSETLESLLEQDLERFSVVVVDDGSTDASGMLAVKFFRRHGSRFANATVIAHLRNQGVSMARNSGIAWCTEPFLFMLDADNLLRKPALSRLLDAVIVSGAAFAYPQLSMFGNTEGIGNADIWDPLRLRRGNYIDAMAMIRREALLAADGYAMLADDAGWEDYDLWCRFAVLGLRGVFLPEVLAEYRVHGSSRTGTQSVTSFQAMSPEMALRYPSLFNAKKPKE
jgi:glycosyltransferase involved in cell wall biosynthesis